MKRVALITGFPTSFLARRLVRHALAHDDALELRCVVQAKSLDRAARELDDLGKTLASRIVILEGDAAAMDLGLSGREYNALAAEVDVIHHCAAITYPGVDRAQAETVNLRGALEVVELAEAAAHLERLVHWSTALVSGNRRGYVLEDELIAEAGFRNVIEETRFRAERVIRKASSRLATTILRPSVIVGDSITGEVDRFDGPYLLILLMLGSPVDFRMPLPGRGDVPLNLVPVDYVVESGSLIASDPRSIGRTFHIVDPDPLSARRVFELFAKHVGRPEPRGYLPTQVASAILRTPGLERFANVPRAFLDQLATEVVYDDRNTRELLAGSGIACPPFESYVGALVAYARAEQAAQRGRPAASAAIDDPLA